MFTHPCVDRNDEFHTDQAQRTVRHRLIDQRFRLIGIRFAVADPRRQHEMHTHRAIVRTADARCARHPAFRHRDLHIAISGRCTPHALDEWRRLLPTRSMAILIVPVVRDGGERQHQSHCTQYSLSKFHKKSPAGSRQLLI